MKLRPLGCGVLLITGLSIVLVASAGAANRADFRDCALSGGFDPDYVQLLGTTMGPNDTSTVPGSQSSVKVRASESADPGDSSGHDTLTVTVSAPGRQPQTVSGAGVGSLSLVVPLDQPAPGISYTLSWAATFDNGNHRCPSSQTPQNTSPKPFLVTVSGSSSPPTGGSKKPGHSHHRRSACRRHGKRVSRTCRRRNRG